MGGCPELLLHDGGVHLDAGESSCSVQENRMPPVRKLPRRARDLQVLVVGVLDLLQGSGNLAGESAGAALREQQRHEFSLVVR